MTRIAELDIYQGDRAAGMFVTSRLNRASSDAGVHSSGIPQSSFLTWLTGGGGRDIWAWTGNMTESTIGRVQDSGKYLAVATAPLPTTMDLSTLRRSGLFSCFLLDMAKPLLSLLPLDA